MTEFKFSCPQCGQLIQCGTSYAGTQINCPVCQQVIVAPQPVLSGTVPPPVAVRPALLRNILFSIGILLLLAGLVVGGWYGFSKIKIYQHGQFPPGLVALWSGEGGGNDLVGGNNAMLTDISFAAGKVGQAFSFNGSTSTIKIPASASLDIGIGDGFTIMAWIKPSDVNGIHPLLIFQTDGRPFNINIGIRPSENGVLNGSISDVPGKRFLVSKPETLTSDVFQHIALTYDKESGIGIWYVNGVIVAQRQLDPHIASTKGDLLLSPHVGQPGDWSYGRSFAGLMDEIAIYNRALSAAEIQAVLTQQNHGEPLTLPATSTGWFEEWMR
jgi:hypothetical protein